MLQRGGACSVKQFSSAAGRVLSSNYPARRGVCCQAILKRGGARAAKQFSNLEGRVLLSNHPAWKGVICQENVPFVGECAVKHLSLLHISAPPSPPHTPCAVFP